MSGVKGWLLFFVVTIYLSVALAFVNMVIAFRSGMLMLGGLMILSALFSLASGIALTRKDAKALEVTFAALGLHGVVGLLNAASFKDGYDAAGTALFTTIAILYFLKSKRVAATYKPLTK